MPPATVIMLNHRNQIKIKMVKTGGAHLTSAPAGDNSERKLADIGKFCYLCLVFQSKFSPNIIRKFAG